ncbi:MAG TPA: fused MFS/spermidine synthase [Elusimicrobiales bacterium]|nr:fused MFS/spermidine synthase [Elusimicrobiales bacterium]
MEEPRPAAAPTVHFLAAIFLGAFLLFQVQPLMAKAILPWFGGAQAVWTTCMLFFQVLLLGGYVYAHLVTTRLRPDAQAALHLSLILISVLFIRILPSADWRPPNSEAPVFRILLLLAVNVGLPFFLLSATSPLVQAWYGAAAPGRSPYRLYALSNAGSMLALLSYPFLVEPFLELRAQAALWGILYVLFAVSLWLSSRTYLAAGPRPLPPPGPVTGTTRPTVSAIALWTLLSACGSAILLSGTAQLTQNVASVPFLWILPLSLYLLSFILCFESDRWYSRGRWTVYFGFACAGTAYLLAAWIKTPLSLQLPMYSLSIFIACMVCHGELAARRPAPGHLTLFYVAVSAGGALGGLLTAVAAPLLLDGPWEYHIAWGLLAAALLALLARGTDLRAWRARLGGAALLTLYGGFVYALYANYSEESASRLDMRRNFYGTLHVYEWEHYDGQALTLMHGQIDHGFQFLEGDQRRNRPVSYYGPASGAGVAVRALRRRGGGRASLEMGFVGLGAGIMAAWGRAGDRITFYELNPLVTRLSYAYFTYLDSTPAGLAVVMGDARLSLEREAARKTRRLDLLALDAFSGDAIPLHLLTREAFDVYFRRLKPDGVLAVHVSNRFLDLEPLVAGLAEERGLGWAVIDADEVPENGSSASTWVLVSADTRLMSDPLVSRRSRGLEEGRAPLVFTDRFSNLFRLIRGGWLAGADME